nr:MAG TPA: hypothetical protein [Caudoviricetes sp.]
MYCLVQCVYFSYNKYILPILICLYVTLWHRGI